MLRSDGNEFDEVFIFFHGPLARPSWRVGRERADGRADREKNENFAELISTKKA